MAGLRIWARREQKFYPADVDTTFLLTDLVRRMAGYGGSVVLSLAVIFACLTTAVGMIATTGEWVEGWTKGKLSYKLAALLITAAIFFVSSTGVSNVLAISGPLFTVLFPMSVVMTFLGLLKKYVPNDGAWKGSVFMAALMSVFDALNVAHASGLLKCGYFRSDGRWFIKFLWQRKVSHG